MTTNATQFELDVNNIITEINWIKAHMGGGGIIGEVVAFTGTFGGELNRFPIPLNSTEPTLNFCLCDGIMTNGLPVPDLRGLFIRGASDSEIIGSTGGSVSHSHDFSGTVGETTLTIAQLASHTHSTSRGNWTGDNQPYYQGAGTLQGSIATYAAGNSKSHTHSLSNIESNSASNFPPYYVLAYIMRIS